MRCMAQAFAAAVCLQLAAVPANALGDTDAKNCAIAIAGSVDASQVSNVCGVPPELLAAIVEEFKQAKRRSRTTTRRCRNWPTSAGTTVENVRQTLDLTNGQIRAAFEILGETNISSEQLASKLVEIAPKFKELQSIAAAQPGDTPEIIALKEQAEAATKAGELDRADALLAEIDDKQAEAQDVLAVNRAATLASRGDLALDACAIWMRRSTSRMRRTRSRQARALSARRDYLQREASALHQQGDEFGDNAALRRCDRTMIGACWNRLLDRIAARLGGDCSTSRQCLLLLGEREGDTGRLEEAVAAFRAALEERTRERVPLDWAATQNNLGVALGRSASARAARRGWRKRLPPSVRRWRSGHASGYRSTGR